MDNAVTEVITTVCNYDYELLETAFCFIVFCLGCLFGGQVEKSMDWWKR